MASDATYQPKTYRDDGGDTLVIASSGTLDLQDGFAIKDTTLGVESDCHLFVEKVALAASDATGGALSWTGPTGTDVIVSNVFVHVTTAATATCTLNIGVAAALASSVDTLLDGVDVGSATGIFDVTEDGGTNGKARRIVAAGKYITGTKATGATSGLVGNAYIHFMTV